MELNQCTPISAGQQCLRSRFFDTRSAYINARNLVDLLQNNSTVNKKNSAQPSRMASHLTAQEREGKHKQGSRRKELLATQKRNLYGETDDFDVDGNGRYYLGSRFF